MSANEIKEEIRKVEKGGARGANIRLTEQNILYLECLLSESSGEEEDHR